MLPAPLADEWKEVRLKPNPKPLKIDCAIEKDDISKYIFMNLFNINNS